MEKKEELALVEKSKKDINSFEKLYDYYFPKIYLYCLNRVADKESAEDITSKVFLLAVQHIKTFDTKQGVRFGSWLYRVAHNKIIDSYRKGSKKIRMGENESLIPDENNRDVNSLANVDYIRSQVLDVIEKIPERYQLILSLKYFSELSNSEISEIMDITNEQVAVVLHRATKKFRDIYRKIYPNDEIF